MISTYPAFAVFVLCLLTKHGWEPWRPKGVNDP
jgi:hypothetical protein